MEDLVEESHSASSTEYNKTSYMLKSGSRFFIGGKRSEIRRLTDGLNQLDRFLQDADATSVEELMRESVKSWLEETEEAEKFEGLLEEDCLIQLSQILQQGRVINFLSKAGKRFNRLNANRYLLSSDAQIRKSLPNERKRNDQMREEEGSRRTSSHNQKPIYSFIDEFVDSAVKDVTAWLTEGAPTRSVYSLVEPCGIGKTSLARKVYNSEVVRGHFDCCAWVDVSSSYEMKKLLQGMVNQVSPAGLRDSGVVMYARTMELFGILRKSLESERYMFVFDDVCHEEFWHVMKQCLPNNNKGSRIIITTTSETVFDSCKEGSFDHLDKLGPLPDVMSMELFCRIMFQDKPEPSCPKEFEQLALEVIRTCRGLPFLILAIAGLLLTKDKVVSEWQKLLNSFKIEVKRNLDSPSVLDVLAHSYLDLPYNLRSCFLYLSIFPEESLISREKLLKLWIAEGFIEEKRGKTLEEVAEEYLNELIRRDLVQPCQGFHGLEPFCQVHRLIHNLAHVKSDKLNFCDIWDANNSTIKSKSHRLSIHNGVPVVTEKIGTRVRSLFLFEIDSLHSSFVVTLIRRCELLTLLEFENVPIELLPEELGNLSYLKYLSLKNTKVRMLPKSLHKLTSLQTLDVRDSLLTELPIEINSLKNLRHLLASVYDYRISGDSGQGLSVKYGIGSLQNLRTLMTVNANMVLVKELSELQNLRRLSISRLTTTLATALCTCIKETSSLESLILQSMNRNETLSLNSISSPPALLQRLILKGLLQKIPPWISRLQNLSMLCLSMSRLTDNPLRHLAHLPNLASLWLFQAYEGEKLHFEEDGFKRLKMLALSELQELKLMEIDRDALPLLEELRIGSSPLMNEVPYGIEHLRSLKVLANYDMPSTFVLSMQPDGGSDYWKVQHIPSVLFCYIVQERKYKLFRLGDLDLLEHLHGFNTETNVVEQHQHDLQSSFCYIDDEDDNVRWLRVFRSRPVALQKTTKQFSSISSGFYTDDLEE